MNQWQVNQSIHSQKAGAKRFWFFGFGPVLTGLALTILCLGLLHQPEHTQAGTIISFEQAEPRIQLDPKMMFDSQSPFPNSLSASISSLEDTFVLSWVSDNADLTESIAWGDMDGDGDLDLVVGNHDQVNRVYRNDGTGTFTDITAGDLTTDTDGTNSIALGDIDGDGDLDLVVGNGGVNKVYRNDGDGVFTDITAGDLATDTDGTNSIALGDMDGDGDLDLVAGNRGSYYDQGNKVYRNDGGGVFTDITAGNLATDTDGTNSIALGDMDGDGDLDLVAGSYDFQENKIYRNDGGGIFIDITAGDLAADTDDTRSVALGDVDGDGDLDLVAGNHDQANRVYRNDGGGVFTDITDGDLATDTDDTQSVAWGDMDGDGDLDLVAGNSNNEGNKAYRNDGGGVFTDITAGDLAIDSDSTQSVAWGDMDGDGDLDLVAGNWVQRNKVYRNDGGGVFTTVRDGDLVSDKDTTSSIAWGDMDGDGDLDLVAGNLNRVQVNKVYRNDGGGVFTDITDGDLATDAGYTYSIAWGDMDGDGDLDLVAGNGGVNKVYRNDGGGIFTDITAGDLVADTDNTQSVVWRDMDGDDDLDLIVGNFGQVNKVYRNDGGGVFTDITAGDLAADTDETLSAAWGDMDGDGDLDLVAANNDHGNDAQPNKVYRNDGGGVFTNITDGDLAADTDDTQSVAWGDIDGDGDLDLVAGNHDQVNRVYRNDGGGVFTDITDGDLANHADSTQSVAWGDMDGDGDLDLVAGNSDNQGNKVYRNDGGGVFTDITNGDLAVDADSTQSVAWGDMDRDGDLDLVAGNGGVNKVYRNDGGGVFNNITINDLAVDTDSTHSTSLGDMDGDGDLDLVAGNHGVNKVYRNDGGVFTNITAGDLANDSDYTRSVAWGDLDGDGDLDLVAGNNEHGNHDQVNKVYRNDGGGVFTDVTAGDLVIIMDSTFSIAWGDMDGDGDLDLIAGNYYDQVNKVYRNDGEGVFTNIAAGDLTADTDSTHSVAWGDMDGDGDLDLVAGNYSQVNRVYRNDGSGIFTDITNGDLANHADLTHSVAWGDMDGDGDLDLVAGNYGQVNRVYRNDGGGVFTDITNGDMISIADSTRSVAWGDIDGDGDLDLVAGNSDYTGGQVHKLYRNDGNAAFTDITAGDLAIDTDNTSSMAFGDIDGDGDLDVVAGNSDHVTNIFFNSRQDFLSTLPSNPPTINLSHPSDLPAANFYAISGTLDSQFIPISYILHDAESNPVGEIKAWYSLNGGGQWFPAVAANGTNTTNLATSPYPNATVTNTHVFNWDTFASGFFGQSDNVVMRFVAYPQSATGTMDTYKYPDVAAGPILYGAPSATTFPFRVRGTQIRVLSDTVPVSNALVYRLPANQTTDAQLITNSNGTPFNTNEQGYLQGHGQLELGDRLVAMLPITSTHNYTIYHTSAAPTTIGLDMFTVTESGVQEIVVLPDNKLILFNMLVSLEWDARQDSTFLNQLEKDIRRTSEILYDMTNGQAALNLVHIYNDKAYWGHANLVIQANNSQRPSAILGGSVLTPTDDFGVLDLNTGITGTLENAYVPGQVRMGPAWNRFGNPDGTLGEDWPRALAHELGHYYFFHPDNYLGLSPEGHLRMIDCPGSVMDDPYVTSEFLTAAEWKGSCLDSLAEHYLGRSDWETVEQFYPMLNTTDPLTGPTSLPLAVTQIETFAPITPTTALAAPFFRLIDEMGRPISVPQGRGQVYLYKTEANDDPTDDYIIAQGTPIGDMVQARGAAPDDRLCVFDYSQSPTRLGCLDAIGSVATPITLREVPDWEPQVFVTGINTTTVAITVTKGSTTDLHAQLLPALGQASDEVVMVDVDGAGTFSQTLTAPDGAYYGYVRVWVPDSSPLQEMILPFVAVEDWGGQGYAWGGQGYAWGGQGYAWGGQGYAWGGQGYAWGGQGYAWGAPTMSSDGQVSVFPLENLFGSSRDFTLQQMPLPPALPSWLVPVGQAYRFEAGGELSESAILFSYLARDVPSGQESEIRIYYLSDGDTIWQRLNTELDIYHNHASARVNGEGIYVLAATITTPPLEPGWNLWAYPSTDKQQVAQALASIDNDYTSIYHYDGSRIPHWLLHDQTVHPDFDGLVNDLKQLQSQHIYYIYALRQTTAYIRPPAQSRVSSANGLGLPPATFYGWITPTVHFNPEVGDPVTAYIDGHLCGETIVTDSVGTDKLAYKIQVLADNGNGCGTIGDEVIFMVDGQIMPNHSIWHNNQACYFSFDNLSTDKSTCFLFYKTYLPMLKTN